MLRWSVGATQAPARRRAVSALAIVAMLASLPAVAVDRLPPSKPRATGAGEPLVIFAAASLRNALDEMVVRWQTETGALAVVSYAGTPTLVRQIQQGAPADLFFSADVLWMDVLSLDERVDPAHVRTVARNRLVLIAPTSVAGRQIDAKAPNASSALPLNEWLGPAGRLAMADPMSVPAGRYGRDALNSIGWYDRLQTRLTGSSNVRLALAMVARAECPLGIVYASDAAVEPRVRVVARFAADAHPPIEYQAAALKASGHPRADAFLQWLKSAKAAAIFEKYGFVPVR